jgi:alpha-amylase/alpha-mannosidase (GH57 family)
MSWEELGYRPHLAKYEDDEIIVVVRDRELSDAQESGMDYGWFANEVYERTKHCDFPALVTTATDGDNGGWFRNATEGSNFWSGFYIDLLNAARAKEAAIQPSYIHDYIKQHGAVGEVTINTGAWNTGWHDGIDFVQWTGSEAQKDALAQLTQTSKAIHDARWATEKQPTSSERDYILERAMWHLLKAETSCNFYWGEAWLNRYYRDLEIAQSTLAEFLEKN